MSGGIAAGAPTLRPVNRDVIELGLADLLLKRIDQRIVRKHPHVQESLRCILSRERLEPGLEPQWKQRDRHIIRQSLHRASRIGEHGKIQIRARGGGARTGKRASQLFGFLPGSLQLLFESAGQRCARRIDAGLHAPAFTLQFALQLVNEGRYIATILLIIEIPLDNDCHREYGADRDRD